MSDIRETCDSSESEHPRITNRGVQNTEVNPNTNSNQSIELDYSETGELKCVIDWCQFTIPIVHSLEEVFLLLGIPQSEHNWQIIQDKKILGYSTTYQNGHIKVMTDGTAVMGHHVLMSGQGCREFELYVGDRWKELFQSIIERGGKFSRLDIAIDDFKGYFSISDLVPKIQNGELRSKFKRAKRIEDILIKDGSSLGHTLYFGRGSSSIQIRMYEKNHEQNMSDEIKIWNRTEIQLRDNRAFEFAIEYANKLLPVGELAMGVVSQYLTFVDSNPLDTNKARWKVSDFWQEFIGDVAKVRLATKKPDRSIERIQNWLQHQVSKSMALITLVDPTKISDMITQAYDRLDEKDEYLLETYYERLNSITLLEQIKKEVLTQLDKDNKNI